MQQHQSREYSRSKISIAAELIPEGGEAMQVEVKDLSLHGIMVHAEKLLEIGQKCQIRIMVGHYQQELPITAEGSVVRIQGSDFAIQFDSVGVESNEELERKILTSSDDPDQCLKEFTQEQMLFDPLSANDFDPSEPH